MNKAVVCLPTYNEKENLEKISKAILESSPLDLLIIDDNSPDGTGEIADRLAAADSRINVLHRKGKEGLGKAYLEGFAWAIAKGYELILQMDADFSHPVSMIPKMIAESEKADLVIASRYVKGGGTENWPLKRQFISRGGSFYSRLVLGVKVRDLTGGFKCWRRNLLEDILKSGVKTAGFGFQIEMNYRAVKLGYQVTELPFVFVDRVEGTSKMSGGIFTEALTMVWKLRALKVETHPFPNPKSVLANKN